MFLRGFIPPVAALIILAYAYRSLVHTPIPKPVHAAPIESPVHKVDRCCGLFSKRDHNAVSPSAAALPQLPMEGDRNAARA